VRSAHKDTTMNHHVPYRVTPATVDRIDEENASCVTARVMCPTGNNPEDS